MTYLTPPHSTPCETWAPVPYYIRVEPPVHPYMGRAGRRETVGRSPPTRCLARQLATRIVRSGSARL